jgi:hypothetical protein
MAGHYLTTMVRLFVTAILLVLVTGCSPASTPVPSTPIPTQAPAEPTAIPTPPPAPLVKVSGNKRTPRSKIFKLTAGSYRVDWTVAASKGGCLFSILLIANVNGKAIADATEMLFHGGTQSGSTNWRNLPGGAYVIQEDRSAQGNCTGTWSTALTPE